jgi:AcrR family transcriptional regulator
MAVDVQLVLNDKLYLRDPQHTTLGKKIIEHSIVLIEKLGFDDLTFRKLAQHINCTEASIYRYFENKHLLLLYLVSWYWEWVNYILDIKSQNIFDPITKLETAIDSIADASLDDYTPSYIEMKLLHHIVITESTKAYHTKGVDKENQVGLFLPYKNLAAKLVFLFEEISPDYPYPRLLASTLLDMANAQVFYAQHLKKLTDIEVDGEDYSQLKRAMKHTAFALLDIEEL